MDLTIQKAFKWIPENDSEIRRPTERVKGDFKKY